MWSRRASLLVAVGAVALATAAPAGAAPAAAEYVAMGSSFAAGPGIPSQQPGTPQVCARSDHNYASLVAGDLGLALADLSCSGATVANVLDTPQADQPPQVEAVGPETRVVTVTIGGNDVNYLGSLGTYSCLTSGGSDCGSVDQDAINRTFGELQGRLENVVHAVHDRAPEAKVVLVEYLTIVPAGDACDGVPLTGDQLTFERSIADRLADFTQAAGSNAGATVVDVAGASAGHDSCSGEPWVEKYDVAPGRTSYHPNEAGMAAVADLVKPEVAATA
ncbi:SGNH/GDSL hydrolase family protein [Amycolatopsis ultiminotia]|uniref:SGNH/GDSL hydrolase family protein n=1 Tax=Amycolatopsis ultiminotia TaxID=543629 RepID=A0ABP6V3R7_9PSEU